MHLSTRLARLLPALLSVVTIGLVAAPALAANFDDGITTIGTDFTREPIEQHCRGDAAGCTYDAHFPLTTCAKIASSRLRYQIDADPDKTVREYDNFTSCTNYYWDDFHSTRGQGHHMDGKVTSGTGREHFFYTDEHDYS